MFSLTMYLYMFWCNRSTIQILIPHVESIRTKYIQLRKCIGIDVQRTWTTSLLNGTVHRPWYRLTKIMSFTLDDTVIFEPMSVVLDDSGQVVDRNDSGEKKKLTGMELSVEKYWNLLGIVEGKLWMLVIGQRIIFFCAIADVAVR